jgi:hypothetical protein
MGKDWRILTTTLQWPAGEPPFASGKLSVPTLGTPVVYNELTFSATDWTDVSGLVTNYNYSSGLNNQVDVLSLTIPMDIRSRDLDRCFKSMRVILVQERYYNGALDTDWLNIAYCISTGYASTFERQRGYQSWTVNALDVLMLAGLDIIGDKVYQADIVQYGDSVTHFSMALVGNFSDAFEFGLVDSGFHGIAETANTTTLTDEEATFTDNVIGREAVLVLPNGTFEIAHITARTATTLTLSPGFSTTYEDVYYYVGAIHPNWADRPAPQFWSHNVTGETIPVPLAVAGDALQAVFGEGVFRLSKNYCESAPGTGGDYKQGLGYAEGAIPDVRCHMYRFAQPVIPDRLHVNTLSDTYNFTSINSETTGYIQFPIVDSNRILRSKLTVILQDGTGRRYTTSGVTDLGGGVWKLTFTDSSTVIAASTNFTYADCNTASYLVQRLLFESGFQQIDSGAAFYINTPEVPLIGTESVNITLPPLQSKEAEGRKRLECLEELKTDNSIVPSWVVRAKADGEIYIENIKQKFGLADSAIIPLDHYSAGDIDRTDMGVFTKVIIYGTPRQLADATQYRKNDGTLTTVITDGDLPAINTENDTVTVDSVVIPLNGYATRGAVHFIEEIMDKDHWSYKVDLETLFDRTKLASLDSMLQRPWCWSYSSTVEDFVVLQQLIESAWVNSTLCEIEFKDADGVSREIEINQLNLDLQNSWGFYAGDYYKGKYDSYEQQVIAIYYYDLDSLTYQPLVTNISSAVSSTKDVTFQFTEKDFVTRQNVLTNKIKVVCVKPFTMSIRLFTGWPPEYFTCGMTGVALTSIEVWPTEKLRGVAEIGKTEPFTGSKWNAVKDRMRTRTFIVKNQVEWASKQETIDNLAAEWLYEVTRNLSPRSITGFRPDVIVGDTIRMLAPTGEVVKYGDSEGAASISGDTCSQITDYTIKTTEYETLYWELKQELTIFRDRQYLQVVKFNLYSDVGLTTLVGSGTSYNPGVLTGTIKIEGEVTGSVDFAYTQDDTGTFAIVVEEQISKVYLYGATDFNTNEGALYWTLTNVGDVVTLNIYKDVATIQLVASCSIDTGETSRGLIVQENFSGIEGLLYLNWQETETSGQFSIPTYLVTAVERSGGKDSSPTQKFTVINYADPYFED